MALTPQEAQELAMLEAELGQSKPRGVSSSGLTPQEAQELAMLEAEFAQPESGFFDPAINAVSKIGSAVDSISGAPTRAAISAAMNGKNPVSAFAGQFADDPSLAPTGKEIAAQAGLSQESMGSIPAQIQVSDAQKQRMAKLGGSYGPQPKGIDLPSPAGVAGFGIDVVADPLNFIPVGIVAKSAVKGAKGATTGATKLAIKGSVAALDAASGTKLASETAETVSKYIDRVIDSTKGRFNPKIAQDFDSFANIAKKNNIDPGILPETVEFGPNSTIAKKAKTVAEGPGGEYIQERYIKAQGAVENALEGQIARIGGGVKYSDADAGNMLVEAYNKGIKSFFDQDMLTHSKVIENNPGMVLNQDALKSVKSKLKGIHNKATGRSRRGFGEQQSQANQLLKDLDIVERSLDKNGNLSYKRASELLTNLGEEAFKKVPGGSKIPVDQKGLQEIYFSLRDAMYESSAHVLGPESATELAMNNQLISDFLKEKGRISKLFEGDVSPDKLFKRLAESGDTNQLEALKEVLSPEDFSKFKGAMLDKIIVRGADKSPLYKSTIKNIEKKKSQLSAVFQPEEIAEFSDVLRLGDRVGDFVLNSSNTNTASRFAPGRWMEEILQGGADELTLEQLKQRARGKARAIPVQFKNTTNNKVPILTGPRTQANEAAKLISTQERNKESEKRKRAISGGK